MKTNTKIILITLRTILKITKIFFSKEVGFFANFAIFLISPLQIYGCQIPLSNILFILIMYPIFFEVIYEFFLKNKVKEAHKLADKAIEIINKDLIKS